MYKIITILLLISNFLFAQDTYVLDYSKVPIENFMNLCLLLPEADSNNFSQFLFDLAVRESNCDWKAVCGDHIGYWQMGKPARTDVGLYFDTYYFYEYPIVFAPNKQKITILFYVQTVQGYMDNYIEKYENKYINGILITKSGIIASSHLVGFKNVMSYLDTNGKKIEYDGNDTSLEEYLLLFSGYEW